MRVRGLALVAAGVLACMSFDLDSRRFRCDEAHPCTDGWVCGSDGYCARPADAASDARIDALELPGEMCGNNVDDDGDGLVDCADSECSGDTTCGVGCACIGGVPTETLCVDNLDNDRDGAKDCLDADCPGQCVGTTVCCPDGACRAVC